MFISADKPTVTDTEGTEVITLQRWSYICT